ncbi:MAG: putative E3 ubiquitin-protein ligase [Piccolia ochrophora]|nr:MAG: putative E3 ubiquitin-protein ligase [Piccolia ochrophora]
MSNGHGPLMPDSPKQWSRHNRSISQPFLPIFGMGKKAAKKTPAVERVGDGKNEEGADDDADADSLPSPLLGNDKSPRPQEKGFISGRCMTCDSLVRWPKELHVFRCTICLMINDLKPRSSESGEAAGLWDRARNKANQPRRVLPLSLSKTENLIDECVTNYLRSVRDRSQARLAGKPPSPPQSPKQTTSRLKEPKAAGSDYFDRPKAPKDYPAHLTPPIYLSSRPLDGADYRPDWKFPEQRPSTSADMFSASLPGRASSSLDQSHRGGLEGGSPVQPARRPPRPPRELTRLDTENSSSTNTAQEITNGNSLPRSKSGPQNHPSLRESDEKERSSRPSSVFRPLEDYIISNFGSYDCVNSSFTTLRPTLPGRSASEGAEKWLRTRADETLVQTYNESPISDLDGKTLLIGDIAENGSWWMGAREAPRRPSESARRAVDRPDGPEVDHETVSLKTPRLDWAKMGAWYHLVLHAGKEWKSKWRELNNETAGVRKGERAGDFVLEQEIEDEIEASRLHAQRTLLKATEVLLKRPGRPIKNPKEMRFLLILLGNPLLFLSSSSVHGSPKKQHNRNLSPSSAPRYRKGSQGPSAFQRPSSGPGQHSSIIKRVLGMLSNLPNECHRYLVSWFSRYSEGSFRRIVELVGGFVTYRLSRQHGRTKSNSMDPTGGLIPTLAGPGGGTSAQLHAALGLTGSPKPPKEDPKRVIYSEDWQIKAAARVMALLFAANNTAFTKRGDSGLASHSHSVPSSAGLAAKQRAHSHGQMLPTSDFYNTLLDYSDLVADFEAWESRRGKFSFCQYPFFLSIWAKIQIMEFDARRQMEIKARDAFFNSIMSRKMVSQYLFLRVRRDCLVEDSLRGVSEVVGTGQEDIKKGLRIEFMGEEGIDAGGLRKEWFLLLVREVFDPNHGLFVYDEDSQYCYFNPHCFETSDQFFLVGVLLGLAIYNSTILDVALPPFAFKKLIAAAPSSSTPTNLAARLPLVPTLDDLAEFRPALAHGLQQLLDFDGDVEETFCRDFVVETNRYGQPMQIPLCEDGEKRPVTSANRREFVELYVHYVLDSSVARQFEPFKRGFFTVCGGNALSLFRPEEIELLVRGSDEPLDISSLRAVARYDNWETTNPGDQEPLLQWFWEFFERIHPGDQRKLLGFITGSDRIPAMGATNLTMKVSCLGDDCERFPIARTCFNALSLWRYSTREKLESKLWTAVVESEGFGLK